MAKVILQNTREHDITLAFITEKNEAVSVTIPAAVQDPEDRNKLLLGEGEADSELIAVARKKSQVVDHYFEEGWLKEKKAAKTVSVKDSKPAPDAATGAAPWNPAK